LLQKILRREEDVEGIIGRNLRLLVDQVVPPVGGDEFFRRRENIYVELAGIHGREPRDGAATLDDLDLLGIDAALLQRVASQKVRRRPDTRNAEALALRVGLTLDVFRRIPVEQSHVEAAVE